MPFDSLSYVKDSFDLYALIFFNFLLPNFLTFPDFYKLELIVVLFILLTLHAFRTV